MQKLEFLNLEPKTHYLGVLGSNFEKSLPHLKSAPSNLPYCKFWYKNLKFLNLITKMPDLRILGLEFKNIIAIFGILESVLLQHLVQK